MTDQGCWVVRGNDSEMTDAFREKGLVAIGWTKVGDMTALSTRESLRAAIVRGYGDWPRGRVSNALAQLGSFRLRIREQDIIATPIRETREIMIGAACGPYRYEPGAVPGNYPNLRPVQWKATVSRDRFSLAARNSLGSIRTVFSVQPHRGEFLAVLGGAGDSHPVVPSDSDPHEPETAAEDEVSYTFDGLHEPVAQRIADHLQALGGYEFQTLVSGVLQAMGYHVQLGPRGRDQGVDVTAYPDPLGVESPRIKVQVKHRAGPAGGPELRELIGLLRSSDRGLFVSTGGFTKDAEAEAARSDRPISLVNWDRFVTLLHEHYERLDAELGDRALARGSGWPAPTSRKPAHATCPVGGLANHPNSLSWPVSPDSGAVSPDSGAVSPDSISVFPSRRPISTSVRVVPTSSVAVLPIPVATSRNPSPISSNHGPVRLAVVLSCSRCRRLPSCCSGGAGSRRWSSGRSRRRGPRGGRCGGWRPRLSPVTPRPWPTTEAASRRRSSSWSGR